MSFQSSRIAVIASIAVLFAANDAAALPTSASFLDAAQCDTLSIPKLVDEIGDVAVFPPDEQLEHAALSTADPVCLETDISNMPDFLVEIINVSGRDFVEVWYVADPETGITNFDGFANDLAFPGGNEAFRIDSVGVNQPLIFESISADNVWQAGEAWQFVLQDYVNQLGLAPDAFLSQGIGDASSDVTQIGLSSGSIIAIETLVPEPGSLFLAAVALVSLMTSARRRR